jgi:hypothetical protein
MQRQLPGINTHTLKGNETPSFGICINAIPDDLSWKILKTIAIARNGYECKCLLAINSISYSNLSSRQLHSRLVKMVRSGLIMRRKGKYLLTSFGKIFYNSALLIEASCNNYWKLWALDCTVIQREFQFTDFSRLVNALVDNDRIKEIILNSNHRQISED